VALVYPLRHVCGEELLSETVELVRAKGQDEAALREVLADCKGVVTRGPATLTERLIAGAPKLQFIVCSGSGSDSVDIEAATRRGIPVVSNTGAAPRAVAEFAIGAMIFMQRRMLMLHSAVASPNLDWARRTDDFRGNEMTGSTVGVVGFGAIGQLVARMARAAFDVKVMAYDPFAPATAFESLATRCDSLDELMAACRTVSVHVPLLKSTRNLIGRKQLRLLGPEGVLVDTARGGIVNEVDLVEALKADEIRGAALDVFDPEPPNREKVEFLLTAPNLLLTPHCAGLTDQAFVNLAMGAARNVLDLLAGRRPANIVNPQVYDRLISA